MTRTQPVHLNQRWPSHIATFLIVVVTLAWVFWGVAEMYFEGWWGSWLTRLPYLVPGIVCLALTLIALTWPRLGGWLIIAVGGAFTLWWWAPAALRGELTAERIMSQFPVSGVLVLIGAVFILKPSPTPTRTARPHWAVRYRMQLLVLGLTALVVTLVSATNLPVVLTRVDDGDRGERLIAGNGVELVWAPQGPGWNWRQAWGGYPSWNQLAWYGRPPPGVEDKGLTGYATEDDMATTGLCRYLSADGLTLAAEPQDVWRLPTTDELVRSLARHGENAGCEWEVKTEDVHCRMTPDKETPLWAPDEPPVYYWSAEEYDRHEAFFISFNGQVSAQAKDWGNPRHGYRCVREP